MNYDASGDVLSNGTTTFSYDGASRLRTSGSTCYVYNAEGVRTAKGTWASGVCGSIASRYILNPAGQQVTELTGSGATWLHTNVFNGGTLLATYDGNGLHFHFADWLGTERAQVNATGTVEEACISLPFGDSLQGTSTLPCGSGTDATEHHFTGKEHDAESGLDYFGARYYQSSYGRWMSPDWSAKVAPIPYAKMYDPQTLNLYAYVGNHPLSLTDPDGHDNSGDSDPVQYQKNLQGEEKDAEEERLLALNALLAPAQAAAYKAQQNSSQSSTPSNAAPTDPIQAAVAGATGASVTPSSTQPQTPDKGGHHNETEVVQFSSIADRDKFLQGTQRPKMLSKGIKEFGFGAGMRFKSGLHMESGHLDSDGNLVVTAHIDRFYANGIGVIPHLLVDVTIGEIFFHRSAGLDK